MTKILGVFAIVDINDISGYGNRVFTFDHFPINEFDIRTMEDLMMAESSIYKTVVLIKFLPLVKYESDNTILS